MTILARTASGELIHALRPGTVQKKAYTGTAGVIDDAVGENTTVVRVYCTTDAHILIGSSPTATANHTPIAADSPEYFRVAPGVDKVSAIQQSTGGDLFVTEMI